MTQVNISPLAVRGDSVKDAGKVYFAEGTAVEWQKGMSYTTADTYCVAPIGASGHALPSMQSTRYFRARD